MTDNNTYMFSRIIEWSSGMKNCFLGEVKDLGNIERRFCRAFHAGFHLLPIETLS